MENKTIAYLRVSTSKQDNENQKHKILEYANNKKIVIDEFVNVDLGSTTKEAKKKVLELIDRLQENDTLITTELSRLGRTASELIANRKTLLDKKVTVIFTNQEFLNTQGNKAIDDLIFNIFSVFAQMEKEFISERTIQALEAKKANYKKENNGKELKLGHNKTFLKSKYDEFENEIYDFRENLNISFEKICALLDREGKKGLKAQSLRTWFTKRYIKEKAFNTYQKTVNYKKHLEDLEK